MTAPPRATSDAERSIGHALSQSEAPACVGSLTQPNVRPPLSDDRRRPRTPCDRRLCQSQLECATLAPWPTITIEPDPDDPNRSPTGSLPAPFVFAARPAVIDHLSGCSHGADSVDDPSWPDSPAQVRRRTLEPAVDRVRRRALLRPGLRGVGGVVRSRTPLGGVLLLALPSHRPEHPRRAAGG